MSCKCFNKKPSFKQNDDFSIKYNASKCSCNSRFTVIENKSKFSILSNKISDVEKIKIDGYLDNSNNNNKCDYLFTFNNGKDITYIFVELKGKDISHAIIQIQSTIEMFYNEGYLTSKEVRGFIVHTRYPANDGSYRKAVLGLNKYIKNKTINFKLEHKNKEIKYDPINDKIT